MLTPAEIEPAALALLQRHGAAIMSTARRFASTPEDAEDAYQRSVEILLTKAPTTSEDELIPWLRTVVKHEAWALRRQRLRAAPIADDGEVPDPPSEGALTHEQAERLDRLRLGAEAMQQLKPHEVRALLLRAEGYTYKQIQDITGWTYTKVNRCLTEGRKAFLDRVAGIEAGTECDRLAPVVSKLADGEATAADLTTLRPHLRTCLSCRASLREYRRAPATAAALFPAVAFASPERPGTLDLPARLVESLAGWGQKAHGVVEMASAQKVAAVAATTAALAGGGAATVTQIEKRAEKPKPVAKAPQSKRLPAETPAPVATTQPPPTRAPRPQSTPRQTPEQRRLARQRERRRREEQRALEVERSTPAPQQEFEPAWAAGAPSSGTTSTGAATSSTDPADPAPQPTSSGGGAEEFAP